MEDARTDLLTLRKFGLLMTAACLAVLIFRFVKARPFLPGWAYAAVGIAVLTLLCPRVLEWPYRAWMRLGHVLGAVNSRILFGLFFFGVLTPIGWFRKRKGSDSLSLRNKGKKEETYRVLKTARDPKHLERMF